MTHHFPLFFSLFFGGVGGIVVLRANKVAIEKMAVTCINTFESILTSDRIIGCILADHSLMNGTKSRFNELTFNLSMNFKVAVVA